MGWRDHLLRLLARGIRTPEGAELDSALLLRVLDRISEDAALSARLDELDEDAVLAELLALYEAERQGSST